MLNHALADFYQPAYAELLRSVHRVWDGTARRCSSLASYAGGLWHAAGDDLRLFARVVRSAFVPVGHAAAAGIEPLRHFDPLKHVGPLWHIRPLKRISEPVRERAIRARDYVADRLQYGRLSQSLWARLFLLVLIFVGVPIALYGQFSDAEKQKQDILMNAVREKGLVLGRSVEPILDTASEMPFVEFASVLDNYTSNDVHIKLLLKPAEDAGGDGGFFFVAASPAMSSADLAAQRQRLVEQGILDKLAVSCAGDLPLAMRAALEDGREELLTSITPVRTDRGCWALIISHSAESVAAMGLGKPYWQSREVQLAAIIYLVMALLVIALFLGLWRNLRRFGQLARLVRERNAPVGSFVERNTIPELREIAVNFDHMIETMRSTALGLRRAAEDNAHAFKTPLGIIQQAMEPLRRRIELDDTRGQRAITAVDASLAKLEGLVASARRLDEATADSLDLPRDPVDLSALTSKLVEGYSLAANAQQIKLRADINPGVVVLGSVEMLEIVLENILDNALSFSPKKGIVRVTLANEDTYADLTVEDQGPGVPEERIDKIFERYYSSRTAAQEPVRQDDDAAEDGQRSGVADEHYGIGLWIVRRNVEAIGGTIRAENMAERGLRVRIQLPLKGTHLAR